MIRKNTSGFACYSLGRSKVRFGILEWGIFQSAPSKQYKSMENPVKKGTSVSAGLKSMFSVFSALGRSVGDDRAVLGDEGMWLHIIVVS